MNVQPFLIGEGWIEVLDGNDIARDIFHRHYSRYRYADGRQPALFVGPGEKLVLLTADAGAVSAWRRERHRFDNQEGVNCAIFRRETGEVASELLRLQWRSCGSAGRASGYSPSSIPARSSPHGAQDDRHGAIASIKRAGATLASRKNGCTFWSAGRSG
ncbi:MULTISPECIES: hypothetical protein [unclassified Mesorhizobium]|uniref:hypothetical protein n=1 Tax=unclassified Mesorhizobium TaxID=325217 RepID=UPI000FCA7FC3|nr:MULTISPECIES: hypothetical protein [unclassified Mesorhizobium]RUV26309.1 hypothetical protein EOA91_05260 [Mesorhizobium sp. M1A.F.Ca.IN.022.04.1.1]RWG36606.1 MAG: hypothetical protein EOQ60_04215 [Mesorhizobium sp.]RWI97833.1 MAG: hypothetical protein EOR22_05710 [Mesorhizobium sp.]TIQ07879.1 MAG: hypothetical protein E5X50_16325 [Mesorhizobium sp.]TIR22181.1 MAG: hypothetical protein E5X33_09635 [Mesorhizobium sp.]